MSETNTPEIPQSIKEWLATPVTKHAWRMLVGKLKAAERERDEAREKLSDWENAAAHVEADHADEVHCGCVPVLRKLLTDARSERDESRNQLADIKHEVDCKTLDFERMKQKRDKWRSVADGLANWIKSGGEWGYGQEMKDYDELKAYEEAKNL